MSHEHIQQFFYMLGSVERYVGMNVYVYDNVVCVYVMWSRRTLIII